MRTGLNVTSYEYFRDCCTQVMNMNWIIFWKIQNIHYLQTVLWNAVNDGQLATYSKTVKWSAIFRTKFAHNFRIKSMDKFKQHNNDVTMLAHLRFSLRPSPVRSGYEWPWLRQPLPSYASHFALGGRRRSSVDASEQAYSCASESVIADSHIT